MYDLGFVMPSRSRRHLFVSKNGIQARSMSNSTRWNSIGQGLLWTWGSALLWGCMNAPSPASESETLGQRADAVSRTGFVVAEIQAFNAPLDQASRNEKYTLMKASPFAFYRGSNHLFWKDWAQSTELNTYGGTADTRTWLGGDMHTNNTGSFDDDEGDIVFGINDWDESVIADYQLDIWRMAVSLLLIARQNGGFSASDENSILDAFSESYLDSMDADAGNGGELSRKFWFGNSYGWLDDFLLDVEQNKSREQMLATWTEVIGGVRRFRAISDLESVNEALKAEIASKIQGEYVATLSGGGTSLPASYVEVKDVAKRVHAGTGSIGQPRYYVLIEGNSGDEDDDRILDVKAQGLPSAWAYISSAALSLTNDACGSNMALRTVLAQKAQGYRVDDHLGWLTLSDGRVYSVRERSPWKESFPVEDLNSLTRFTNMAEQWGVLLATHHARADKDWNAAVLGHSVDSAIKARTNGSHSGFRAKVRSIALGYATQVQQDYQSFAISF